MSALPNPIHDQLAALRAGECSARELTAAALRAIDADTELNAFCATRPEAALAEAEEADRRRARGEQAPLLGVPLAIKDDTDIAGEVTAFGTTGTFAPRTADAEVVRRLRAAGAVVVGKTTTPELGQWPFTEGPAFGATRNPWNLAHTPGGSSGGAAAAVAAGLVGAAIGSDGAGSIRIPAAWTNLVGVKPQRGRISTWPELEPFNGLVVIGPLARSVADAALLLEALAGNHPQDRHRPPPFMRPLADAIVAGPGRLRIALSTRIPFSGPPARLDGRIAATVRRLADVLCTLGHDIEEADPAYGLVGLSFVPRSTAGVHQWARRLGAQAIFDPRTLHNARTGRLLGGPVLAAARAMERPLRAQIGRIFRRFDVVLAPTTAQPPPPIGTFDGLTNWQTDKRMIAACPYCWPWNVIGWPAVNVPAGFVEGDLPIGASLLGPAGSEPLLLALAAQLEALERWQCRRPPTDRGRMRIAGRAS